MARSESGVGIYCPTQGLTECVQEQARQDAKHTHSEARTDFDVVHDGQREQGNGRRTSADEYGQPLSKGSRGNGRANGSSDGNSSLHGYKVASTNDYLGYPKSNQAYDTQAGLWNDDDDDVDDDERDQEMW